MKITLMDIHDMIILTRYFLQPIVYVYILVDIVYICHCNSL